MNLLLLEPHDLTGETQARVTNLRQISHVRDTLKLSIGDALTVGLLGQRIGRALLTRIDKASIELDIEWRHQAPAPLPLTLIVALPRPKMLKRIVQTFTAMGVKNVYFINAWKVEKSYWQSPWLSEQKLRENCILGMEQAKDTVMPEIHLRKLFKPFVEDELPELVKNTRNLVAHPAGANPCPFNLEAPCTLAIGPEGGFTPYEVEKLEACGFDSVHLGPRILRVETAVPALISRLYCHF